MNELHSYIETESGLGSLRYFIDEFIGADPSVRARIKQQDLIRHRPLGLDEKLGKHFPGSA
ncbi:hypothetical protein [Ruegeria sp. MALMAid1280]|uniref:hypothetical protein n=1 Tax=Ruegeria sp. MALMAid1280 TaxID=3411634 RepID=UPI003B9E2EED